MLYWTLNPNDYEKDEELQKIREARGYKCMVHVYLLFSFVNYAPFIVYNVNNQSNLVQSQEIKLNIWL